VLNVSLWRQTRGDLLKEYMTEFFNESLQWDEWASCFLVHLGCSISTL